MRPLVSIIIVNWNGMRWLPECFKSLSKQDYKNIEIIFVDNASKDESVSWVKKKYPKTRIKINKENLGFAGANDVGFDLAKGEYILFLNNDTRVTRTFLSELITVLASDQKIAGAQSKILLMEKPDTHDSVGAFITPTGFLYHYGFGKKDQSLYNKQMDLYTAKGACMIFKKSVLDKVSIKGNIFDPDYFAYFEESDMCHRVWLAGYRIVYAYKSVIYHKMGATSSGMNNAFIQYHSFKNRIRTYIKNLQLGTLVPILFTHLMACEMYSLIVLIRRNIPLWTAIQKSIWWNIVHLSQTMQLRGIIQKSIRTVSDRQIDHSIMRRPAFQYYIDMMQGRIV